MKLLKLFLFFSFTLIATQQADAAKFTWTYECLECIDGYKIYWGTSSRNYIGEHTIEGSENMEATLSGFIPGVTYYVSATAYINNLESDWSNEAIFVADSTELIIVITEITLE